jgi:hypothetical protein
MMTPVTGQVLLQLVILAVPVAAIAWTVTHEELFREVHDFCVDRSQHASGILTRKFFYLLTCEYCFSHYVAAGWLVVTRLTLLYDDWRGYVIAWLALVWLSNHYIAVFARLRLGLRSERLDINLKEAATQKVGARKAS